MTHIAHLQTENNETDFPNLCHKRADIKSIDRYLEDNRFNVYMMY